MGVRRSRARSQVSEVRPRAAQLLPEEMAVVHSATRTFTMNGGIPASPVVARRAGVLFGLRPALDLRKVEAGVHGRRPVPVRGIPLPGFLPPLAISTAVLGLVVIGT